MALKNAKFDEKIEIREWCKGVHCVGVGDSFPTNMMNYFEVFSRKSWFQYLQLKRALKPKNLIPRYPFPLGHKIRSAARKYCHPTPQRPPRSRCR